MSRSQRYCEFWSKLRHSKQYMNKDQTIFAMEHTELEQLPPEAFEAPDTDDTFPFFFPTLEERRKTVPSIIAQQWSTSSHYWFFHNGLCNREDIRKFLQAQALQTLDSIAASFDIEPIDLVSLKRKQEGVILSKKDRQIIIDAILSSVTA